MIKSPILDANGYPRIIEPFMGLQPEKTRVSRGVCMMCANLCYLFKQLMGL